MAVLVSPVKTMELFVLSTDEAALLGSLSQVQAPQKQPDAPCKNGSSSQSQFNAAVAREPLAAWLLFIFAPLFVAYAASPTFQAFFDAFNEDVITLALLLLTGLLGQRLFRPTVPFVAPATVAAQIACDCGSLETSHAPLPPAWQLPPCLLPMWHWQRRRLYYHWASASIDRGIGYVVKAAMKVFKYLWCFGKAKPKRRRGKYGVWDFHEAPIAERKLCGYMLPTQVVECRSPPEARDQIIRLLGDHKHFAGVVLKPILE